MRSTICAVMFAAAAAACGGGGGGTTTSTPDAATNWVANFNPPPVQPGYTRYVTPIIPNIQPGDNVEYCQWVAPASDVAQDVIASVGEQSPAGHHAIVYATKETNFATGETHICTENDMISISFMGAIGGEGVSHTSLPEGLFFRLPANQAVMINTHWLNATDNTVDGQAVLDVKYAPADASHTVADIVANNGDTFTIAPNGPTTYDVSCTFPQDVNYAMITNHMHQYGTSAYTELIHPDGTKTSMVVNDTWPADAEFNPVYSTFSEAQPVVAHAGDVIHTHCEWMNTTNQALLFPTEMCVGAGFYFPGNGQLTCSDGQWLGTGD
jgi:hypothetical protein